MNFCSPAFVVAASAKSVPSFQRHPPTNYQVSIVQGASLMSNNAFSPISIKAGDMVTWTNDDGTSHTITSGSGPSDPNIGKEFDSSAGFLRHYSHQVKHFPLGLPLQVNFPISVSFILQWL